MGWTTIKNGELLTLAAKEFDVFVTVDRNLSFQQNLPGFEIAVLVLRVDPLAATDSSELPIRVGSRNSNRDNRTWRVRLDEFAQAR